MRTRPTHCRRHDSLNYKESIGEEDCFTLGSVPLGVGGAVIVAGPFPPHKHTLRPTDLHRVFLWARPDPPRGHVPVIAAGRDVDLSRKTTFFRVETVVRLVFDGRHFLKTLVTVRGRVRIRAALGRALPTYEYKNTMMRQFLKYNTRKKIFMNDI